MTTDLEHVQALALHAIEPLEESRHAIAAAGGDPHQLARFFAGILVRSHRQGSPEIPIQESLRVVMAVERLRSAGADLDPVLELALAVGDAVEGPRWSLATLVARTYVDGVMADARQRQDQLRDLVDNYRREAHTDYLTGLANRSEFEGAVHRQVAGAERHHRPFSLMLLDLDLLKRINDSRGHHAGDDAIRAVSAVIRRGVRTTDLAARLGGDEFAVLMPESDLASTREVATRVQRAVDTLGGEERFGIRLQLSCGYAQWKPGQSFVELYQAADRMLYRDKRRHRARRAQEAGVLANSAESRPSSAPTSSPATLSR